MPLLISIPVHEWPESFADQLASIAAFAPGAWVVAHISPTAAYGMYPAFQEAAIQSPHAERTLLFSETWTSQWTVWACHVAAFRFAERIGLNFTHFAMEASNSMFVRPGVENHVEQHGCGMLPSGPVAGSGWTHEHAALIDRDSVKVAAVGRTLKCSQCEGAFFHRDTFRGFIESLDAIGYDHLHPARGWPQEEVWPATFLECNASMRQFTYVSWQSGGLIPQAEYVREIATGNVDGVYAVKAVPRTPGHWMRKLTRSIREEYLLNGGGTSTSAMDGNATTTGNPAATIGSQ